MDFSSRIGHLISKGECDDVEFKAHAGNTKDVAESICAFANKKGGYIIFGIEDKTKDILGIKKPEIVIGQIENTNRNTLIPMAEIECKAIEYKRQTIIVAHVKSGNTLHMTQNRKIYVRTGASDSLADIDVMIKILNDRGQLHFEDFPVRGTTFEDLNIERVNKYLRQRGANTIGREPKDIFAPIGLLKENIPTVAALLFFGQNPQQYFPSYCMRATKLENRETGKDEHSNIIVEDVVIGSSIINGNLNDMISEGVQFIRDNLKKFEPSGDVLKEAIVNALVHRDYCVTGEIELKVREVQVKVQRGNEVDNEIDYEMVEIISPGGLASGRTVNDLLSNPISIARNPRVAIIMRELGFADNSGNGIYKIRNMRGQGMPEAIFKEDYFSFSVILTSKKQDNKSDDSETERGELEDDSE